MSYELRVRGVAGGKKESAAPQKKIMLIIQS